MDSPQHQYSRKEKVGPPFAETESFVSPKGNRSRLNLYLSGTLVLVLAGAVAGIFTCRYLNDPYRTLDVFPVPKYLDDYQILLGSKYKAAFRVEADLDSKNDIGRLMLFSTQEDTRPIAVLVPTSVGTGIRFIKGQTYTAEVEVKEGGLIYADSLEKN